LYYINIENERGKDYYKPIAMKYVEC
jgi:hypothetical protein